MQWMLCLKRSIFYSISTFIYYNRAFISVIAMLFLM